jgi:hypothetical protein
MRPGESASRASPFFSSDDSPSPPNRQE